MIGGEEDRTAINAAREANADWFAGRKPPKPFADFIGQGANLAPANLIKVGGQTVSLGIKVASICRVGIGASN